MWTSHAIALFAFVLMLLAWLGVQSAWRKVFPQAHPDPLDGRFGCRSETCPKQDEEGVPCPRAKENK